jgi:hypothetical protein
MKLYLAAFILALSATSASAAELTSQYTRLNHQTDCEVVRQAPEGEGEWSDSICPRVGNFSYFLSSTDGRETVSYGQQSAQSMQGFSAFNYANGTVEWRLQRIRGRQIPVAAIQRWFLANGDGEWATQILVVSKVGQPGGEPGCVVGYISANEGASANLRARNISNSAADFDCDDDQPIVERAVRQFVSQG